jgi:hypothetical protein
MILTTILWAGLIYRYWQSWKHFRQYETPFVIASITASLIMMNYVIFGQFIASGPWEVCFLFLAATGLAADIYFVIGAFIARHRDFAYSRFVDDLLRVKYKEKKITRSDFIRGRYPDDVRLATTKHPRASWYSKRTLIGYLLTGLAGALLIPVLADPNLWLPPIPHYLVPLLPNLLGFLILFLAIGLLAAGLLILAERWPYAGLAAITLTIVAVAATIHLPHLFLFQVAILVSGSLGSLITLSKQPVKPTTPVETPPELAALVPPRPPYTATPIATYIGGTLVLAGGILTIAADIFAAFINIMTLSIFAWMLGVPIPLLILGNLWWIAGLAVLGTLALVAAVFIFRKDWQKGGFLGLTSGALTLWMLWGIVTLVGAIIVLVKHPTNETRSSESKRQAVRDQLVKTFVIEENR